jgi:hypothetical protein
MKVAIIKITDMSIDCDRVDISDQLEEILEDQDIFVFENISDTDSLNELLMSTLMNSVPKDKIISHKKTDSDNKYSITCSTSSFYESKDFLYTINYVSLEDIMKAESITKDEFVKSGLKTNIFASQLASTIVVSDAVIIRWKLSYDIKDSNVSTKTDIGDVSEYLLMSDLIPVFKHKGLIITADKDMKYFEYIQQPLENIIMTDSDYEKHYRYYEYEVFNHILMVSVDIRPDIHNSKYNSVISQLTGSTVYGDVLVSISKRPVFNELPSYIDLSTDLFNNIYFLMARSHELVKPIATSDTTYFNFFKLLELSKNKYSKLPLSQISAEILNKE